jgi:serine/threonine protein kinase
MNGRKDRVEAIFQAAMEVSSPQEREAYLLRECGEDTELRLEVEELLKAAKEAEEVFESWPQPPALEQAGSRIGRYHLLQKIGEGGCGVVYMAEQETPVRRKVALKIVKLGMDTHSVIARFEAERQVLALLDHPNIAKVLDAGATENGRPYFVMELVKGVPVTHYCDENNLDTKQRLQLYAQVCHAIQHAHQMGIIHRDIKPSNILVADHDGVPVPKVIDFGIAKATTGQRLTDKTCFTPFEQFIGTPAYVSPEQAKLSGLDVDTRSDIYSLGVLLYELLTGKTPFEAKRLLEAGLDEIRRIIQEEEPPRPSTRLHTLDAAEQTTAAKHRQSEPTKLVHLIRGDLDWIVMKTLEKDRSRRYNTALDLAADLQNYLAERPVKATPPSLVYRSRKLIRRRRKEAAVIGLFCALVFSAAAFAVQHRRGETLRQMVQLAQWRQQEAQMLNRVIAGVALNEPERELARSCLQRLGDRVQTAHGSEIDRDLLARFLVRDVRLKGRLIQVMDHPALSFSASLGIGYPVSGVAAVLHPLVALDGIEAKLDGGDVYISGGTETGGTVGAYESIHVEQVPISAGVRNLSCIIEAQLVHTKPDNIILVKGAHAADFQAIGDPIRIVFPSTERLFVRQCPPDYPVEATDERAAGIIAEGFAVASATASLDNGPDCTCEVEFNLPRIAPPFPIALSIDLLEFAGVSLETSVCGLLVDENGRPTLTKAMQNLGVEIGGGPPGKTKYKVSFVLRGIKSPSLSTQLAYARFRIRSSRQVALAGETLEHFLSIPELIKVVPVTFTLSTSGSAQGTKRH